jgi:hypothetical protein
VRTLFDDDPVSSPTPKVVAFDMTTAKHVAVQLDAGGRVFTLYDGRITDLQHVGHIAVHVGGTTLAFTRDGKRCLTGGFGPRTMILGNCA